MFIDGLNEYESSEAGLAELSVYASISQNVKICVSIRSYQVFEDKFGTWLGLRVQGLTSLDIRQYLFDKLERNSRMRTLTIEEPVVRKDLITGVFLWVTLFVVSLLRGPGNHDVVTGIEVD